jgi:hypothetical protein
VVLYGCEALSLMLKEESRLRVCKNRALRQGRGNSGLKSLRSQHFNVLKFKVMIIKFTLSWV